METTPKVELTEEEKAEKIALVSQLETKIAEIENARATLIADRGNKKLAGQSSRELRQKLAEGKALQRKLEGKTDEAEIIATYTRTHEDGKKKERIELNFEEKLASWQSFYESHGVALLPNFSETMQDIWSRNHDAMKAEIEKFGFDEVVFVPTGLDVATLHTQMSEGYNPTWEGESFKESGSFAGVKEEAGARMVLLHKKDAQNLKDHHLLKATLGKKAETLIAEGEKLTLADYLIYQRAYFKETGKHLDEIGWTWLPGSRGGARVVHADWLPTYGQLRVNADDPDRSDEYLGCRLSRSFL